MTPAFGIDDGVRFYTETGRVAMGGDDFHACFGYWSIANGESEDCRVVLGSEIFTTGIQLPFVAKVQFGKPIGNQCFFNRCYGKEIAWAVVEKVKQGNLCICPYCVFLIFVINRMYGS